VPRHGSLRGSTRQNLQLFVCGVPRFTPCLASFPSTNPAHRLALSEASQPIVLWQDAHQVCASLPSVFGVLWKVRVEGTETPRRAVPPCQLMREAVCWFGLYGDALNMLCVFISFLVIKSRPTEKLKACTWCSHNTSVSQTNPMSTTVNNLHILQQQWTPS
jgi:hypothetical protein